MYHTKSIYIHRVLFTYFENLIITLLFKILTNFHNKFNRMMAFFNTSASVTKQIKILKTHGLTTAINRWTCLV